MTSPDDLLALKGRLQEALEGPIDFRIDPRTHKALLRDILVLLERQQQEIAEQRAELTGVLSEFFNSIPACYDTPADHYREMARRIVEDRDVLKHENRTLRKCAEAAEAKAEDLSNYVQHADGCPAWPSFPGHFTGASKVGECTCGLSQLLENK